MTRRGQTRQLTLGAMLQKLVWLDPAFVRAVRVMAERALRRAEQRAKRQRLRPKLRRIGHSK